MLDRPARALLVLALTAAVAGCGGDDAADPPPAGADSEAASDYPTESIRFLVPYGAGGPTDLTSRTTGECLQRARR